MTSANTMEMPHGNATERGQQDEQSDSASSELNVGNQERWISAGAGALMTLYGLRRMSAGGLLTAGLGAMLVKRAVTGNCNVYQMLGINTAQGDGAEPGAYFDLGIHVEESFTILKPADELYAFWRKFDNLPRFMKHLKSVEVKDDKRSQWIAEGPMGMNVQWNAEIINDQPNRLIAWRSLAGAEVDNAGSVTFRDAPGDRGTEVSVVVDYIPPAGAAGAMLAKLFGRSADSMIRDDLRNFKRLMETGEIATTQGQPRGNCSGGGFQHSGY